MDTPPTTEIDHPPMLTVPEAAAMLRCHPNTVRAWVRQGKLNVIPMGAEKVTMFLLADVERLKKPLERVGVIVKDDKHAFPVVGIGASAGGLDAISRLLQHLPTDLGLAYVFVTHQEKEQEKTLADLLRKKTAMPVFVVENGMKLDPDRLYVAPADMHTAVVNSTFTLQQPRGGIGTRIRPIDTFFTALANEYQNNAIGIVLSGGGMDGTEGLRAIKAEDGLTIVQDATAQELSMPQSAQEAEVVDLVRAPEDIARELVQLVKELFAGGAARIPSKHDNEMRRILRYLLEQRGIDFTEYKEATIHRRIIRRMVLSKCNKLSDYATLLRGTPTEVDTLCNDLLINVTSFFRDPAFHKALTEKVFPDLFADRTTIDPLRIWVAACAGGEEVVSIAITLLEFLGDRAGTTPVQIFATDLNERTIEKARLGVYKKTALQDLDPALLAKYFMHVDGHYQVIKPIRDLCVFAKHDLLKDPPFSRVDLISCQNVLIYLENAAQARVLKSFHYALKTTGYLALGKSETTGTAEGYFTQSDRDHKVHQKKRKGGARSSADLHFKPGTVGTTTAVKPPPQLRPLTSHTDLDRTLEQVLLQRYVPASVLVNKDLEIVRFMGGTAPFLSPGSGRASLNLLKMVREDLAFELRTLLQRVRKEKITVRKSGIPVRLNTGLRDVALEVVPMGDVRDQHYLVLFKEEARAPEPAPSNGTVKRGIDSRDKRIAALEQELREAREQVRLVSEEGEIHMQELQAANEEVVSSNEELQSINEEMETSKEELQSINEEYATINEELRLRNDALQESEERLRLATKTGKVGLWDWDILADRITWSDSLYEIHGVKKETFEANVKSFAMLVYTDDRDRVKEAIEHAIQFDAKYEFEFRAVRPNGEVFWLFTTASVLRVGDRAVRMTGATLDITERKNAESALQHRTRALELMNAMGDTLIAELDTQKIVQAVTDTGREVAEASFGAFFYNVTNEEGQSYMLYTLSGIPREAFSTFPMPRATDLFGPTFRGEGAIRIADVRKDPRYGHMAPHHGMPKGHPAVRSYLAVPVTSRDGKVLGGLFFGHPEPAHFTKEAEEMVTTLAAQAALAIDNADLHAAVQRELQHQQQSAAALSESEARYRKLIETLPAAVFTCDAEGRIMLYNEACVTLWGQAPDPKADVWNGAHAIFTKYGEPIPPELSPMAVAVKEGRPVRDEIIVQRKDGSRRNVLVHPEPLFDAAGAVIGAYNVLIDITERHHAEAERQQLSSMLERSLNEIYIFDLKSLKFEYVNHGALGNLGYTLEQMRDMTPLDIKPEFSARQFNALVKPLLSGEKDTLLFNTLHRRADGTDYPVEVHLQIVENGPTRSFMAMILDITERKLDEERLRVVTGTGKLGIWDWDIVADTITWTDPVYEIHGVVKSSFEPTMEGYAALIHPDDRERISSAIKAALEDDAPYEVEFRTMNAEGVVNWVYTSAVVLREGGRPVRMMGGTMNINQRKEAEEAARRLAAIVESSDDAIISKDLDGILTSWNKGAERMFGYTAEEIIGKPNVVLFPEDRYEEEKALFERLKRGERIEHYESVRLHKDGSSVQVSLTLSPLKNEHGEIVGASKTIRDITEEKRAREIIHLSEERFHLLADNVVQLIWMAEADGSTMWFNKRWFEFTGMTGEQIRMDAKSLHHPDHFERVTESLKARAAKGEQWEEQFPLKSKEGKYHWFLATAMPVRDPDGTVARWFGTLTDITSTREADERLRQSEERFRLLADNIGQLAWIAEPNGDIHWYNKRWFEYSGTTLEEMRGWGWQKIHHPDHVDAVTAKFKKHIEQEKDWEDTFPIRGADGEYRWFLSRAFPVRDEQGHVLRWFGTNTDVTEERAAREELQQSEERFRLLADNMSQMAYTADANGVVTWVNRRWLEYTGLAVESMNQGGWGAVVDPDQYENMVASYAEASRKGEPWEHIFRLRNTLGEYRWFLSRSMPIKNAEGKVERWFGTNTDITEQKLAEEALEESAKHKDHFLATLAHELRNPLAPLKNGLQLMELAPDEPELIETTRAMMVRQLDHMVRLVDDLMDLSRISRGKIDLIQEDVKLAEVIGTAMEASKPLIERNEHELHVDVSTEDLVLHGDAARLTQVVSNLLNNAAKYTPRGGRIHLGVRRVDNNAVISVRDNGIGIDRSAIDRVFDMFAQVDPEQKGRNSGGLGIGLNVVQRLVHMHKGRVEARSEGLGKGSEFVVRLPLIAVTEKPKVVAVKEETPTFTRRVLVVDDNEDIALSMSMILKKIGHTVAVANDGEHAVAMVESFRPDVILMDIGMPKMNGYEACATIRATEQGNRIHIIAVSGWGQEEDRKKSQAAGFDRHVVKPMERYTLERVIAEAKPHVGA